MLWFHEAVEGATHRSADSLQHPESSAVYRAGGWGLDGAEHVPNRRHAGPSDPPPMPDLVSYGSGVGADEMAYPPGVAVGWVEVLGSVFEPAELGSEALELADATV